MNDELDEFLDAYCGGLETPAGSVPRPMMEWEGPLDDYEAEPSPPPIVIDTGPEQVEALLQTYPFADRPTVESLVSRSDKGYIQRLLNPAIRGRALCLLRLLLTKGSFTYLELSSVYADPRRAKSDLLDLGVTLKNKVIHESSGRRTTLFELDPEGLARQGEKRVSLTKAEHEELLERFEHRCNSCKAAALPGTTLADDHRVGFHLVANSLYKTEGLEAFQPLCVSCNNRKQFCTRGCPNLDPDVCRGCGLAYPDTAYTHIGTLPERHVPLTIRHPDMIPIWDTMWPRIKALAAQRGETPGETLVRALAQAGRVMRGY